jgi:putative DNA primase/helicase
MNALTPTNEATMRQFLTNLWGADQDGNLPGVGIVAGLQGKGFRHYYAETIDAAIKQAKRLNAEGADAYFAMSLFKTKENRKGENANGACSFWMDIDCGDAKAAANKGYLTQGDAAAALKGFCKAVGLPKPTFIVSSGYGLHIYWVFNEVIPASKWRDAGHKLKRLTEQHSLLADPSRTADIASVLRVPGTTNFKDRNNPKPVEIVRAGRAVELDAFMAGLSAASPVQTGGMAQATAWSNLESNLTREPPSREHFRSALFALPDDLPYDEWRDMIWAGLASGVPDAEDILREWSQRSAWWNKADDKGLTGKQHFAQIAASFDPSRANAKGVGSLFRHAKQHGWTPPSAVAEIPEGNALAQAWIVNARADRGDVQNAELFARRNIGRLLFIAETKQWLEFDPENGWLKAKEGEADRAAKAVLTELARYAAAQWREKPDDSKAKKLLAYVEKSHELPRLRAMIELAKSEPCMTARLSDFDADPWLLGVANGVLNLKPGDLMPMSPDVLVSKRANVAFDPRADCPQWKKFVREVQTDPEARSFLQRLCGYFLSGVATEHIFPFISGEGGNGKGVFVETVAHVLGDYAVKIETAMLMEHKRSPQAASPDLMKLRGARLGYCSETSEGQRLDSARVKELTGGDTLTARPLYGHPVTFEPSHKLLMMGNYRPEVNDNSAGMWRRVVLIPFAVDIQKAAQDVRLPEKLKAEGPGILNWMLAGLNDWRKDGLQIPERIRRETDAYRDENDLLGEWVRERCELAAGHRAHKGDLYFDYQSWCGRNGLHPMTQPRFTRRLRKQYHLEFASDERTIKGIRLKNCKGNL